MVVVAASSGNGHDVSVPIVVLIFLVLGSYGFGYAMAVMRRANSDYKTTKAAVPGLRKAFWSTWRGAVKAGFWILVGMAVLVLWMLNLGHHSADANTAPSPSASISSTHSRR
jgi:hypothetical protein